MYRVIRAFHDLQDGTRVKGGIVYHEYREGDIYPRKGLNVSKERIDELSGTGNKQGVPLIIPVEDGKLPGKPGTSEK